MSRIRRVISAARKKRGVANVVSRCAVRPARFRGDRKGFRPGRIQGLCHPRGAVQELRQLPDGGETIEREFDGVRKEHRFIRADTYGSYEDAVNFTLSKARQIIDLQGVRIFD